MISVKNILEFINIYKHDSSVAAIRIHEAVERSLVTKNPVNGLEQIPAQVRWERDSLLISQKALMYKIAKLQLQLKNKNARIKKLESKLKPF